MKTKKSIILRLREERGVSTAIVAVSLIGLFSAAILSLSFGSAWSARRTILTATDATALDQARVAALTGAACNEDPFSGRVWTDYLFRNATEIVSGSEDCVLHPDAAHPGTGYVLVEARKVANAPFAGLFGFGNTTPYALSAAEYGFARPEGLRPMSFCIQNDHVEQWIWYQNWLIAQGLRPGTVDPNFGQLDETTYNDLKDDGDAGAPDSGDADILLDPPADGRIDYPTSGPQISSYSGFGVVHRMFFTKSDDVNTGDCGTTSGNWGWIDFDGGSNPDSESRDWIENGYDGQVASNDCDADGATGDACEGDPGSSGGSVASALQTLIDTETQFYIPIFTNVSQVGATTEFEIWGFLPLILRGYKVNGAENTRYFDFEFKDQTVSGSCCSKTGGIGTPKGVKICAVDHDGDTSDARIDTRCGQ